MKYFIFTISIIFSILHRHEKLIVDLIRFYLLSWYSLYIFSFIFFYRRIRLSMTEDLSLEIYIASFEILLLKLSLLDDHIFVANFINFEI